MMMMMMTVVVVVVVVVNNIDRFGDSLSAHTNPTVQQQCSSSRQTPPFPLAQSSTSDPVSRVSRGVYRGGSGRNLRPVWLKGEKNSTLKGENSPRYMGHIDYCIVSSCH